MDLGYFSLEYLEKRFTEKVKDKEILELHEEIKKLVREESKRELIGKLLDLLFEFDEELVKERICDEYPHGIGLIEE